MQCYYSDTLLPLFHDTVVPLMSKLNFKATRFVSAKWSVLRSFYSESIHAPASALYEAHLAVHVNTLSRNIKEFYDKNLKEFVDLHIAPSVVACSAKLAHALSGAGVLLAGLNLHLVPESMTNTFLQYRSALIAFLKANETVRNTFGEHTDSVVVTLVNFVPAFLVYILLQLLLTFVISVAVGPKRRKSERTHGEERASIRFMRKGSQEHLDIKGEHEKDVTSTVGGDALDKAVGAKDVSSVVSKTDGTLLGEKNGTQCLSPLRTPRTSNLPNKSPKGPNSPYSGIPLSKTGG